MEVFSEGHFLELAVDVKEAIVNGMLAAFLKAEENAINEALSATHPLGVRLRALTVAQRLLLAILPQPSDSDEGEEGTSVESLTSLMNDSDKQLSMQTASRIISGLLRRLMNVAGHPAESLAILSALSPVSHHRPTSLSLYIPALIARFELAQQQGGTSPSIVHALKNQLASLMSLQAAEPYYPLLMDALNKPGRPGKKREHDSAATAEEEEVFSARKAHSSLGSIDPSRFPLATVMDMIIGSLQYVDVSTLPAVIERWRPSSSTDRPVAPEPRADPRRRTEEPAPPSHPQQPRFDIQGRNQPPMTLPQLVDRITVIYLDKIVTAGLLVTRKYSYRLTGFGEYLGRLLAGLEAFRVDLFDPLVDRVFVSEEADDEIKVLNGKKIQPADAVVLITAYLRFIWLVGRREDYEEKVLRVLVVLPTELLAVFCSGLTEINYSSLVPIVRQHLAPVKSEDEEMEAADNDREEKGDPRMAELMMQLIGDITRERPNDEWGPLKELLIECCRSPSVILRSHAVVQGVEYLDSTDARRLLFETQEEIGQPEEQTEEIPIEQRIDLAMAMCRKDPRLIVDLLGLPVSAYFTAKLPVLAPMLENPECEEVLRMLLPQHPDFWLRLMGLKTSPAPVVLYKALSEILIESVSSGDMSLSWVSKTITLIMERAPADSIPDLSSFLCAAIRVFPEQQLPSLLQFASDRSSPDRVMCILFSMADSGVSSDVAMSTLELCIKMGRLFKPSILLSAFIAYLEELQRTGSIITPYYMRTVYLAQLNTTGLSSQMTAFLPKLLSLRPWLSGEQSFDYFLRCCKLLLPHSLNILSQLPVEQQRLALSGENDLKRTVREHLFGMPPSVRSRYSSLLKLL